jgi:hypothetical protein
MEFSFSQLLVLLFFLLPLIERFFGKKKAGQKNAPEPVEVETDYDDEPATEMTWEETLEQLESVLKGEKKPAPVPVPTRVQEMATPTSARLEQTYTSEASVRREFVKNEFKSTEAHYRSESLLDTPLVSSAEDLEVHTQHVKVSRQSLREAIVINELLAPPVSRRPRTLNRVS